MEEKRCRKCGTRLLEHEKRCPVCGTVVVTSEVNENDVRTDQVGPELFENTDDVVDCLKSNEETATVKNYWRSKGIWTIFIILVVVTTLMKQYVYNNPIKVNNHDNGPVNEATDSKITISQKTDKYSLATNVNYLGISYVSDDVYLTMNGELLKYDRSFNNRELVLDEAVTAFSEDKQWYYYLDENNDYIRKNKQTNKEDVLLKNVYYVHNVGAQVYYQNDSDGESIHCLDLRSNEDHKINQEVSYSIIVDETKERIFYINKGNSLVSIALDGSDEKKLASNTNIYTYDGEYLYYINDQGLVKSDLEGASNLIYESSDLRQVNVIDKKLIIVDKNIIYTTSLDGENKKKLYTMDIGGTLTFEVVGDKLLVLTKGNSDMMISYEIVGLDGERHILDDEDQPMIKGNEF